MRSLDRKVQLVEVRDIVGAGGRPPTPLQAASICDKTRAGSNSRNNVQAAVSLRSSEVFAWCSVTKGERKLLRTMQVVLKAWLPLNRSCTSVLTPCSFTTAVTPSCPCCCATDD